MNPTLPAVLLLALALPAQRWAVVNDLPAMQAKPSQPFDVTGRAVTWDGKPIAGARVGLVTAGSPTVAELLRTEGPTTGADGTFTLHVPAMGEVDEASRAGFTSPRFVQLAAKGYASRWSYVPAGVQDAKKPVELGDLTLPPGQRMVGRLRDANGPVADALVTVSDLVGQVLGSNDGGNFVCTARSSQGGVFDLPCALAAGATLRVEADGYFIAVREPVAAGTPLEFELQRSGLVEGQVQAPGGQPAARAWLRVTYETDAETQEVRADANGAFRIPLRHAGRWRVHAFDGEKGLHAESSLGEGPATGLVIAMEGKPEKEATRKLQVRAVTKGTGAAVRAFRAVAMWGQPASQPKPWLRQVLGSQVQAGKPAADGTVEVNGPPDEGQAGVVYVVAEGHAPCLQTDVTWDEKNPSLSVELEPEASVRGIVRDAATKQPIAGAKVAAMAASENAYQWPPYRDPAATDDLRTAADGSFRLGQLDEGDWQIVVGAEGRPGAPPLTVTLKKGEARGDVVVDVPVGARVAGKLVGAPIAAGCRVSLEQVPITSGSNPYGQMFEFNDLSSDVYRVGGSATAVGKPVAADGSFEFTGQALGHYTLLLHVPAPPRSESALFLPVDSFRVRAGGVQRDFDLTGDRVGELRGKVTLSGASTPFENLVAVAEPVAVGQWWHNGFVASGARAFVGRDGTFALPVLRGSYRVAIVDLALGTTIAKGKTVEVGDADAECNVDVNLTKITIELKPAGDAKMATISRVEVRCAPTDDGAAAQQIADDSYDMGHGVRIEPGTTSLTLALPAGEVCLFARSNASRLQQRDDGQQGAALGKLEFAIPGDKKTVRVLEVAPPPEIKDEPKDEKNDKDEDVKGR